MFRRMFLASIMCVVFGLFTSFAQAHHMAPDELQDYIESILIEVGSPHVESDEDDPSLRDVGLDDIDLIIVTEDLTADDILVVLAEILEQLTRENEVCDTAYLIEYDMFDSLFDLTIYVDFCDQ